MLDEKQISIGKLKQAYELSDDEAYSLLGALLPDRIFPYALWRKAYAEFWEWAVRAAVARYQIANPQFPDAGALPEKHFPTQLCSTLLVRFFGDISKVIEVATLERGIDYIIEAAYGKENFPFKEQKDSFFRALREEENSPENWARTSGPLRISSMQAVDYFCITESLFDTIVVDKPAAVRHLHSCGYPLRREVKGVSHALVERIMADATAPATQEDTPQAPPVSAVFVSRSLWEGKSPISVREGMRQQSFTDPVIAHVLYEWCGLKNKTQIGRLLGPADQDDSSYLRLTHRLLSEAATLNIQNA